MQNRIGVEGRHGARVDDFDRHAFGRQLSTGFERLRHHAADCDQREIGSLAHNRCLPECDLIILGRHWSFHSQQLARLEKENRVVTPQRMFQESLGIIRRGWHDHPQAGKVRVHRVIISRVMRGGRVSDADATAQQHRHCQPAVAHILHFCDLIDDLSDGIENKVGEHEVDHRTRARHGGAAAHAHEAALRDRRVAQPDRPVQVEQPGRRVEVSASLADPFSHHENLGVYGHLFGERFVSGLHKRDFPRPRGRTISR